MQHHSSAASKCVIPEPLKDLDSLSVILVQREHPRQDDLLAISLRIEEQAVLSRELATARQFGFATQALGATFCLS
jgi:hypothetical protein